MIVKEREIGRRGRERERVRYLFHFQQEKRVGRREREREKKSDVGRT